ncbi:MAG: hypothetical protein Q4A09_00570 [Capnocytophaga felis]|nr:hypothetical protein [Capnocytophaga felis]
MKKIPLLLLAVSAMTFAQEQPVDLQTQVEKQQSDISKLQEQVKEQRWVIDKQKKQIQSLLQQDETHTKQVDSLKNVAETNHQNIQTLASDLGTKIKENHSLAEQNFSSLDSNISKSRLYWILVSLGMASIVVAVFFFLKKKINNNQIDIEGQLKNAQKTLEEETVKLDNKLIELLENQLKIKQVETKTTETKNTEPDHSLALKVADEIVRIHKNISQMDATTRGLKQLSASVKRIQDNFAANGYELVEMLGKEYNEGMKVVANFSPSEEIETGKQIITRIIKPQVNYKGEMIQSAQIEVSVGQ